MSACYTGMLGYLGYRYTRVLPCYDHTRSYHTDKFHQKFVDARSEKKNNNQIMNAIK